jgi:signal transduction histidine kinase
MKTKVSQKRIILLIVLFPLAVLFIYGVVSYLFLTYIQKNDISQEVKKYEKIYLHSQKAQLQDKVETLVNYIKFYDKKMNDQATASLKNFVENNAAVANNLSRRRKGKDTILTALKDLKLTETMGHLFIMDMRGYVYQHYDKTLSHKIIRNVKDNYGIAFVNDFNRVIKYEHEGFISYNWYKPGRRDKMYEQLVYLKKIAYKNLYIGAGIFIDDIHNRIKNDVLKYLDTHALFKEGFFFILGKSGEILLCPEEKVSADLHHYNHEGFFEEENRVLYSKYYEEYGWYIVGLKSLKNRDIDSSKVKQQKGQEVHNVKKELMLLGLALLASILLSLYLSYIIYKKFRSYEEQINESHEKMMFRTKQALIGELFSMIAHQWRQPINKIASIVALMRAELQGDKITKKELDLNCEEIEESVEYMSETIEDFRTFYKPTTAVKIVDLKDLIQRSVAFLSNPIQKKNITIIQKLADDIEFKLYRNEFLQVMLNLLKNAIDATDEGGTITLRLYRHGEKVIIAVENSGEPISEEVMRKIYEPYFTTKKDSMGLGLYMTKIIVEKHMKGEILIERLPEGTKFIIII